MNTLVLSLFITSAEVGTVIQVTRKQVDLGKNASGGNDYRRDWYLRAFDVTGPPRLLFEKEFVGELPGRGSGGDAPATAPAAPATAKASAAEMAMAA